jgi:quercetin dioxygenase-like cupin family protein
MRLINDKDLAETGVSHNPEIKKKVYLGGDVVPPVTTFSRATFQPGQSVETHAHETMHEVFYILSGKAVFIVEGNEITVTPGSCVLIEAKERHSQSNPFNEPVTWVYFGVATSD